MIEPDSSPMRRLGNVVCRPLCPVAGEVPPRPAGDQRQRIRTSVSMRECPGSASPAVEDAVVARPHRAARSRTAGRSIPQVGPPRSENIGSGSRAPGRRRRRRSRGRHDLVQLAGADPRNANDEHERTSWCRKPQVTSTPSGPEVKSARAAHGATWEPSRFRAHRGLVGRAAESAGPRCSRRRVRPGGWRTRHGNCSGRSERARQARIHSRAERPRRASAAGDSPDAVGSRTVCATGGLRR